MRHMSSRTNSGARIPTMVPVMLRSSRRPAPSVPETGLPSWGVRAVASPPCCTSSVASMRRRRAPMIWPAFGGRAHLRPRHIAFVFQSASLLPALTVQENVALPLLLDHIAPDTAQQSARAVLDRLALGDLAGKLPGRVVRGAGATGRDRPRPRGTAPIDPCR